jgi:signal peptidase I
VLSRRTLLFVPTVAFFLIWTLLLGPTSLGGPASYIHVQGGSMEPALSKGDLVVLRHSGEYQPGDVVAFRVRDSIVIHRIVGGSAEEGFVVQGDNKQRPDHWRPKPDDILGRMWLHIPGGGPWLAFLRQPLMLGLLAGSLGMFMILAGDDKKRTPEVSAANRSGGAGRLRPPPGLALLLLLVLMAALTSTARH